MRNLEVVKFIVSLNKFDLKEKYNNESLLNLATRNNNLALLKYLINLNQIDINQKDGEGKTIFLVACSNYSLELSIIRYISELKGIDLQTKDLKGNNALHLVCKHDNNLIVVKLNLIFENI